MMQAVHALQPPMLPTYHRQNLNGAVAGRNPTTTMIPVPTPPMVARKRKRAHQYTVSYSEVKEVDHDGRTREVIVIDDTPPPPTVSPATTRNSKAFSTSYQPTALSAPIRTRARAALEAQAVSASSSTSTAVGGASAKKRKREVADDVSASARKPAPGALQQPNVSATTSYTGSNNAAADDVRSICLFCFLSSL